MKVWALVCLCLLCAGCAGIEVKAPPAFSYVEIETESFTLASWQKISDDAMPYRIYIEGDGHAFNRRGLPTGDPTPQNAFTRTLAFNDPAPNVVYLARPCQYVQSQNCAQLYWTTGRFAAVTVQATVSAIRQIAGDNPLTLIGFSGGAQMAGLVAVSADLNIVKLVTVAGNLDHQSWTRHHNLPKLNDSLDLTNYRETYLTIPQIHFAGAKDDIVPPEITRRFVNGRWPVKIIKGAYHNKGFETAQRQIWAE